jgi:hypothetical protein
MAPLPAIGFPVPTPSTVMVYIPWALDVPVQLATFESAGLMETNGALLP